MLRRSLPAVNAAAAAALNTTGAAAAAAGATSSASVARSPFPLRARTFAVSRLKRPAEHWADARSAAASPFSAHSDALVRICARASSSVADSQQQEQQQQPPAAAMSGAGAEAQSPAIEAAMAAIRAQGGVDKRNGVDSILSFWFGDWARPANAASLGSVDGAVQKANQAMWYRRNADVDEFIRTTFSPLMEEGVKGNLSEWETTPHGALALIILLDQFPRNSFRGSPKSFEMDPMARQVASRAIDKGFDKVFKGSVRGFFYLPFMHSEDLEDQNRCVALYEAMVEDSPDEQSRAGAANMLKYAEGHRAPIQQFGRFPHRNAVLGRSSTDAEKAYLAAGGGFG